MRLFLALELPREIQAALGALQDRLRPSCRGWRWVRPAGIHLTLRFLGEVGDDRVPALSPAWRAASAEVEPIDLRLERLGVFPGTRRPRVLWVGVREEPDRGHLEALAAGVEAAARAAGFEPEERAFRPHLTLARAAGEGAPQPPPSDVAPPDVSLRAHELLLFRSELRAGGAIYSVLERYPLAAGAS